MEGYIFFLDKSMLFISKNPLFLPYADISEVRFERVSGALTSSARTFDLIVQMKLGRNEHTFSAVAKDEQSVIEDYLKRDKKLKVKNVIEENLNAVNSELVAAMMEDDSDDDDAPRRPAGDDDDEESVDEDFKAPGSDDDDDVAEEFNEVRRVFAGLKAVRSDAPAYRIILEAIPALQTQTTRMLEMTMMMRWRKTAVQLNQQRPSQKRIQTSRQRRSRKRPAIELCRRVRCNAVQAVYAGYTTTWYLKDLPT